MGLFGVRTPQADRMARAKALWQEELCGVQERWVKRRMEGGRSDSRSCTTLCLVAFCTGHPALAGPLEAPFPALSFMHEMFAWAADEAGAVQTYFLLCICVPAFETGD